MNIITKKLKVIMKWKCKGGFKIKKEFKKLISEVNKKLPNYKHIKDFKVVENEFEKTTTQKIKRFGNNLSM